MDQRRLLRKIEEAAQEGSAELDLYNDGITELPPEIRKLTSLQTLNLSVNQLTTLPPEIGKLTSLQTLNLWRSQLTTLPPEIGQLMSLQTLYLWRSQLTTLPPEIGQLTSLQTLYLGGNQLTTLPPEIGQLTSLQTLYLGSNQLTTVPPEIGQLASLQGLWLENNQLTALPPEIGQLTTLRQLWLHDNRLTTLPPEIGQLENLRELRVEGNPLVSPPLEIALQGVEAIQQYFASLEKGERPLDELKVILVGDGGAGKTSLINRLVRNRFDKNESKTQGIKMEHWEVAGPDCKVCANIWDFGGQEIMHSTHQFFLSKRSLYILVLDGRKEEDAEYWLKSIESFGGDSPILVALNKMDENPGFDVNRRFLRGKYKGIRGFFRISCSSGDGIPELKGALIESLGEVEIRSTKWPEAWFRVKQCLENMKECFISQDDYDEMCSTAGIDRKGHRDTLVRFLHDLGVIVHFHDFRLEHMHVLNPRWLTTGVYQIINSEELAKNKGVLELSSLAGILASKVDGFSFPKKEHPFIINIMEKFELCFHIDANRILIPDLLEVQEPEINFDYGSSLQFRIDYDFLPKSIIPRFIVKKHAEIKGDLRWRTGVVLKSGAYDATAIVRADAAAKRIYIFVAGQQRRDYLTVLRSVFLEINGAFEKLEYTERIPLPDNPDVAVGFRHLLDLERDGTDEFRPEGAKRRYRVRELLGTVYIEPGPTMDDFFRILQQIVKNTDEIKEILEKAKHVFMLQPNFQGLGINLYELVERFKKWREKKSQQGE